jgi:hypothetical protein
MDSDVTKRHKEKGGENCILRSLIILSFPNYQYDDETKMNTMGRRSIPRLREI